MYECETCTDCFYDREDCHEHMNDYGHWPECQTCPKTFTTQRACDQHMNATGHWDYPFHCETCTLKFRYEDDRDEHMAEEGHWRNYCKPCDRHFNNENNLKMHLNSRTHRGTSINCPFCKSNYTTASGLSHHLETGSCPKAPTLNRDTILGIIRERDPHGVITNKQLTWYEDTTLTYSASDQAWNGRAWECYFCHHSFRTQRALNQHLQSPAHRQRVYHCPNGRCPKEFVNLAAMLTISRARLVRL